MSNLITFETKACLEFVDSMLRDEDGVSHKTYEKLYQMFVIDGHTELWRKISRYVDATDDRFYIAEDAPSLIEIAPPECNHNGFNPDCESCEYLRLGY
jgi:hypothetical protein